MSVARVTVEAKATAEEGPRMSNATTSICPKCGNDTGIPIVYGLPGPDLMESAQRGEVMLGGCLVMDENPDWRCTDAGCGHEWKSAQVRAPKHL